MNEQKNSRVIDVEIVEEVAAEDTHSAGAIFSVHTAELCKAKDSS